MLGHEDAVLAHTDEDAGDVDTDDVDADEVDADEVDADEVDADEVDNENVVSDEVDASDVTSDELDEVVEEEIDADDIIVTNSLVELLVVLLDGSETVEEIFEVGSLVVEELLLLAIDAVVKLAEPVDVLIGAKLESPSVLVYVITSVAVWMTVIVRTSAEEPVPTVYVSVVVLLDVSVD
ncbi:hypothetical protein LTR56_022327 [Elasticomyces elasticus]|nr:hypothetical protein LTR56_022327 [Elasticomyces elasticus]KAK3629019.1 hypothetical protein LTR22_022095 [Elasticomyces elasticus]KAK4908556.1 hypothetical protein LTR49_022579 [Elasticomyces elasticus]KAK5747021.1 hypothetical protein LTS12_022537 [Elasticomyces elasticus]